jgi:signal transduction histidine kinase
MSAQQEAARLRHEAKLYASLLALGIGGILIVIGAWFAAQVFASRMADTEAHRRAVAWSERALGSLQWGKPTFDQAELSPADKARLHDLLMASDIYRYVLYRADGTVFWSSKLSKIGSRVEGEYFAEKVAKGETFSKSEVKKASEIDGLLWRKGTLGLDPQSDRQVNEVYIPVAMSERFVGAIEVYVDMTDLIAFYATQARTAAAGLSAAFGVIFLLVATMMLFYARERRANAKALLEARDEALAAERASRELAGELQLVNDDVLSLNRELADNMRKLSEAQDEIIRKGRMAQLGQLTATVAHELRNPLGVVRTAAYLLDRKLRDADPAIRQTLQRIDNGVVRCDHIITELLDFARSTALQLSVRTVDDWVAKTVDEEAGKLPRSVVVECRLGLGGLQAELDFDRLQRVIVNLLTNAAEAMVGKDGGDRSSFAVQDPRIVVTTRLVERGIEIEVADNGPGVAPEIKDKILEPLFTTKSFGVGLGLPAVQKILEQHGGALDVRSRPGEGAVFVAWLPAKHGRSEAA